MLGRKSQHNVRHALRDELEARGPDSHAGAQFATNAPEARNRLFEPLASPAPYPRAVLLAATDKRILFALALPRLSSRSGSGAPRASIQARAEIPAQCPTRSARRARSARAGRACRCAICSECTRSA